MKKPFLIISAAALTVAFIAYSANEKTVVRLTDFNTVKPTDVRRPAFADSASDALFAKAAMLKYRLGGDFTTIAPGTTFPAHADTAGVLRLAKPDSLTRIERLHTFLRAERFCKGTLSATSAEPFALFLDGKEVLTKSSSEDAISQASTKTTSIELQPEKRTAIEIRVLTEAGSVSDPQISVQFIPDNDFENVAVHQDPGMAPRFSIETTVEGKRVSGSKMSPDGNWLLVNYSQQFTSDNIRRWTELVNLKTCKTVNADVRSDCFWMPTGATLGYTVVNGALYDLYTLDPSSNVSTLYASNLPEKSFTMAPDCSYILYYKEEEAKKPTGVMTRYEKPDDRIPGNNDKSYLQLYNLSTGAEQPLVSGGPSSLLMDISPDSKRVLFASTLETPDKYPFYDVRLLELNLTTMRVDTLLKDDGSSLAGAVYSPDGKQLFAWGGANSFGEIGADKSVHPIANDYDIQGYLFDIATRKVTPMTKDFAPSLSGKPVWNRADSKIYFRAENGFCNFIYRLDPKSGKITQIESKPDYASSLAMGLYGKRAAYTAMSYTHAGGLYLVDLGNDRMTTLADPYAVDLAQINFGETKDWAFTASDGTRIDGTMTLPPDFDPNKKYPLIVYYYGGTLPSNKTMHSPYTPQLFASRDYVVYVVNPSGTIGYGQEFSGRHVNAWGKRTAEDIIEGVKEFCKQHPFVDKKKIGCLGASYGGFMTQYLTTQTDIFAAAVSHAGISNVTSYWGEGYWGYSYNSVAAAKSYPWTDPELFTRQGSLFNADKIHTPLLLLHGTADTNVPIGESVQLFNALKILGRQVEFITVKDQDHIITDYDKRCVWHATIMAWFARWLQDDPRWWDSMY